MGIIIKFDPSKLSAKQNEVLLLLVSGHSPSQAAQIAGVGTQTVYNWRSKCFGKVEKQLVDERFRDSLNQVKGVVPIVIDNLRNIVTDTSIPARDRISASRELLDLCGLKQMGHDLSDGLESDEIIFDEVLGEMIAEVVLKHNAAS